MEKTGEIKPGVTPVVEAPKEIIKCGRCCQKSTTLSKEARIGALAEDAVQRLADSVSGNKK